MGIEISGGARNNIANVDDDNRLSVNAITQSTEHHANHLNGLAFSLLFSATPTGAGDCFLYVKNQSENDAIVSGFGLWLVANEYIDVKLRDVGTPIGGTDITPANLNSGSGNSATGTFLNGNDITGLSGGTTVGRFYHVSGSGTDCTNFEQDVILKKNGVLTMYVQTGTTALAGHLNFNYHETLD